MKVFGLNKSSHFISYIRSLLECSIGNRIIKITSFQYSTLYTPVFLAHPTELILPIQLFPNLLGQLIMKHVDLVFSPALVITLVFLSISLGNKAPGICQIISNLKQLIAYVIEELLGFIVLKCSSFILQTPPKVILSAPLVGLMVRHDAKLFLQPLFSCSFPK